MGTRIEATMKTKKWFHQQRQLMVHNQLAKRGVTDPNILKAFSAVPREQFVKPGTENYAYRDSPLSIEANQTISQPCIVALMIQLAELTPESRVLEVGTGRGYAAAVTSQLVDQVYTVERLPLLASLAAKRLAQLGYDNIEVDCRDGTLGWPEEAPFDAILVAAAGPKIPEALPKQLRIGGHLVIPVGDRELQSLVRMTRLGPEEFKTEEITSVRFVPLIGQMAWHS